jgi:hypothetical protein
MPVALRAITPQRIFRITPREIAPNLRVAMETYLREVRTQLRQYPPPSRQYQRTFRLRRGWHININPDGSRGELLNSTPYAVYVQGPRGGGRGIGERQTRRNRIKGWLSVTDVARLTRKRFDTIVNRAVKGRPGRRF